MSNTIAVPTPIRVSAYIAGIVTNALGDPTVTYLAAEHRIDKPTAVFITAAFAAVAIVAGVLALSHLSLPSSGVRQVPVRIAQPTDAELADMKATVARARAATHDAFRGGTDTEGTPAAVDVVTDDPAKSVGEAATETPTKKTPRKATTRRTHKE